MSAPTNPPIPVATPASAANTSNPAPASDSAAPPPKRRSWAWLGRLILGLPALLIAVLLVVILARQARTAPLVARYRQDAFGQLTAGDTRSALIGFRRLVKLEPENPEYRLLMAVCLERLGQVERAEALARTLAPLDERPGYAPAHLWLGQRLGVDSRGSRQRIKDAEEHLQRVLSIEPRNESVKLLLGSLYAASGRPREARPLLEDVADGKPDVLINLATVCRMMGDEAEANRRLEQALQILSLVNLSQPENSAARTMLAKAYITRGEFEKALAQLKKDFPKDEKEADVRKKEMAAVCLVWAEQLSKAATPKPDQVLKAIERGLEFDPDNMMLLSQLAEILKLDGPEHDKAKQRLEAMLKENRHGGLVYLAYANEAWARGRKSDARRFWEKSVEQKEYLALAGNNLAWDLAYTAPIDAARALQVIDRVVSAAPGDPRFRATRGQVLAKLSRWDDARAELEAAQDAGVSTPETHKALADVYDHLGMRDKAADQRRRAAG